jgi:hypothetical protein
MVKLIPSSLKGDPETDVDIILDDINGFFATAEQV